VPSPLRETETVTLPQNVAAPHKTEMPTSLPGVLAEIARRQELLEVRYRSEEFLAESSQWPQRRPAEMVNAVAVARPEADDVRLNIGSIVVHLEAPPAPVTAQPAPAARRPVREPVSRWARSFLDR
jgi:hypothetical protein